MTKHLVFLLALCGPLLTAGAPPVAGPREFRYTNPITRDPALAMRDHCIIKVGEKWYCTGTSLPVWTGANPGVRLLESDDLIHWRHHSWLIDASTLPADCPYNGRFWAPEIHFIQGKYWLTVNSGRVTDADPKGMQTHSVWLFSADAVTGPYRLVNGPLAPDYKNDATLFADDDGQTYLYTSGRGLWQARIDLPSGRVQGSLQLIMGAKDEGNPEWMIGGIEGPFVVKREGRYFMFFSSWTRGYEVGLLKADSPLGPWKLVSREPIFGTRKRRHREKLMEAGGYAGIKFDDTPDPYAETGHNSVFIGPDGKEWICCHYYVLGKEPGGEPTNPEYRDTQPQLGIEPLLYHDGRFFIPGPTWTEQRIPLDPK